MGSIDGVKFHVSNQVTDTRYNRVGLILPESYKQMTGVYNLVPHFRQFAQSEQAWC